MRRTATHLLASPNPAQLEMRILANHGADRRFAFLRARWSRAWRLAKAKAGIQGKDKPSDKPAVLGGLAGYGNSDSDNDGSVAQDGDDNARDTQATIGIPPPPPLTLDRDPGHEATPIPADDPILEARKTRARE